MPMASEKAAMRTATTMVLLSDDVSLMGMGSSDQSILEVRRLGTLSSASLPSSDLGIQLYSAPKVNLEKVLLWVTTFDFRLPALRRQQLLSLSPTSA
jgi:hypothetical protein